VYPNPSTTEAATIPVIPPPYSPTATYARVPTMRSATLRRKEARRPRVSATMPVGTSKRAMLPVKIALATNACRSDNPAPSRNIVFTPQISDADSVYAPAIR
jgi:hypothetical protein